MELKLEGQSAHWRDTVLFQIQDAHIQAKNQNIDEWFRSLDFEIDVTKLFPLKKITELDELKIRKIIGLGESVHGSRSLFEEKSEIVKKLLDKNVKLICFENAVDECLNWDLYVRGIHPYIYREIILENMEKQFSDAGDLINFLDHIRNVNLMRKEENKIRIVGLDFRSKKKYFSYFFYAYKNLSRNKNFLNPLLFN